MERAASTFGPREMEVLLMTATVMVTLPQCGPSPSTLSLTMVRQQAMMSHVALLLPQHSVMAKLGMRTQEW